ncbi:protein NETWORKED 3A [Sesamum alatum]|uniref:Protein NETWORKED 3A n=1 Tax=Sesamum alatum TaxID=300844 RepID=A0AAE1Z3W8_9LAMI|nr:protein NETWORKED 3A [Sesamum alatum]
MGEEENMLESKNKGSSHWWWFDSHNKDNSNRSPWLHSALSELDEKTRMMLKLIEEDADSFAQRAEMYYKKRPELISMVEDFYRTHRSLAERYDQVRSESGTRLLTPCASPLSLTKHQLRKSLSLNDKSTYGSYAEAYGPEESNDSEVDDPEEDETVQDQTESQTEELSRSCSCKEELMRLREELERLREENKLQREQLMQRDEEKRDVIRQLSLAMDLLREEKMKLCGYKADKTPKRESLLELNKLKEHFLGKLSLGEEDSGNRPDGGNAIPGPGAATTSSGLGGLGLEGITGTDDSVGESSEPAGEGKRGVISGESAGGGDEGEIGSGSNAGAAEIVEAGRLSSDDDDDDDDEIAIKMGKRTIKNGVMEHAITDKGIKTVALKGTEINAVVLIER